MEEQTLLQQINREKNDFEGNQIQIVPGLLFNQQDTIRKIYFRYHSKFLDGDIDDENNKKYFYNIVRNPCAVCTKAIDFDTKHIRFETASGGDEEVTWYLERDFQFWMRDKKFGKVLNRIFKELPIFGSVVLKEVGNRVEFVDLRNFIVEQSADYLENSNYIIERHDYTPIEFRKMAKEMNWKDPEKVIEDFHKMRGVSHIRVYERYGEVPKTSEAGVKTFPYERVFIADVGVDTKDGTEKTIPYSGIILKEDEWDGHPYWEFHLDKIPGRWLGVGTVELLFEPQIRQNEIANLQSKTSYHKALLLFKSQDPGMAGKNLVVEQLDGNVLDTSAGDITQLIIQDTNLAFFNEETQKWLKNRDELSFSYDVVQGERLPAGTPLGSAQIALAAATSYFDQIQENVALDIIEMLYLTIIPNFQKENSVEHTLRLVGEDLEKFHRMETKLETRNGILDMIIKGKFPTADEAKVIEAVIQEKKASEKERQQPILKDLYKDAKYKLKIDITGEAKDNRIWAQVMMAAIQAITVDPTILSDPTKRKFFFWWLEANGVSPTDIDISTPPNIQQAIQEITTRGGGGVSKPINAPQPMAGQQVRTI